MSYSYVKTVFPDYTYSNLYDTKIYDNSVINDSVINDSIKPAEDNVYSVFHQEKPQLQPEKIVDVHKIETFKDNQQFFNVPLPQNMASQNKIVFRETFEDKNDHVEYTKHVLECQNCKDVLLKQFNIDSDRIRNEEIMELVSFVIFALFILLLLDGIAKN